MTDKKDWFSDQSFNKWSWEFLQERVLDRNVLHDVIKFHRAASNATIGNIKNVGQTDVLNAWLNTVVNQDVLPNYTEQIIDLDVTKGNKLGSCRTFVKEWGITKNQIGELLYTAFGRGESNRSKRYPSAGALYPVIPLLVVLDKDIVEGINQPGCYLYDSNKRLMLIQHWDENTIGNVKIALNPRGEIYSRVCMAYAVDLRRAITKYRKRGYRHALIEVGMMAQCFRESVNELFVGTVGDFSFSGFNDSALAFQCGMNVRLAPILLVQWFGLKEDGEFVDDT